MKWTLKQKLIIVAVALVETVIILSVGYVLFHFTRKFW